MERKRDNPEIHSRRSIRLRDYDYSRKGLYFITICTLNHKRLFGYIDNGEMVLDEYGKIAYNEWVQTGEMRKNVTLQEFVIMPNHMHGIIEINDSTRRGTMPRARIYGDAKGRARSIVPLRRNNLANQRQIQFRPSFVDLNQQLQNR